MSIQEREVHKSNRNNCAVGTLLYKISLAIQNVWCFIKMLAEEPQQNLLCWGTAGLVLKPNNWNRLCIDTV